MIREEVIQKYFRASFKPILKVQTSSLKLPTEADKKVLCVWMAFLSHCSLQVAWNSQPIWRPPSQREETPPQFKRDFACFACFQPLCRLDQGFFDCSTAYKANHRRERTAYGDQINSYFTLQNLVLRNTVNSSKSLRVPCVQRWFSNRTLLSAFIPYDYLHYIFSAWMPSSHHFELPLDQITNLLVHSMQRSVHFN